MIFEKLFGLFKRNRLMDVQSFAHANRSLLVIVCDPKDDTIFVSHRDKTVCGRISSMDGINHKVVKNLLRFSTFEREIDRFLGALIEVLKCPLKEGNHFYQFVDAAMFNIAKALKLKKDKKYGKTEEGSTTNG